MRNPRKKTSWPARAAVLALTLTLQALGPGAAFGHGGAVSVGAGLRDSTEYSKIKLVHVVFMSHLDVGWTYFALSVLSQYLNQFNLQAIETAETLKRWEVKEGFVFTTDPWLVSLLRDCPQLSWTKGGACPVSAALQCPSKETQERFERAVQDGTIVWHGNAFNVMDELMDPSLFRYMLSLAGALQPPRPILTASNRDDPGSTRGVIPLMLGSGQQALTVGANAGSMPPTVPPAFIWHDPVSNQEILAMWHPGGYGGIRLGDAVVVPGFPEALATYFTGDNAGPPSAFTVLQTYDTLRSEFPNATIRAGSFDDFVKPLLEFIKSHPDALPKVSQEIGDTWIYGAAADPLKLARFRELSRARAECLESGKCSETDPGLQRFSRMLIKIPEHTAGLNLSNYVGTTYWSNLEFASQVGACGFQAMEYSWDEQRLFLDWALQALPSGSTLSTDVKARLEAIKPRRPKPEGFSGGSAGQKFPCGDFEIGFDEHGAIDHLKELSSGQIWADPDHPLGLFQYESYSQADFQLFAQRYSYTLPPVSWFAGAWGKPGLGANSLSVHRQWQPRLRELRWRAEGEGQADFCRFQLAMDLPRETLIDFGAPQLLSMEVAIPRAASSRGKRPVPSLRFDLQWFNKTETMLPEAMWLEFRPVGAADRGWVLHKLGQPVAPDDVVLNGGRHLHGVWEGISYCGGDRKLSLRTLDAALVSPGRPAILDFNNSQPRPSEGIYVNLFNNLWGNNFVQWYPWRPEDADSRFRFELCLREECLIANACASVSAAGAARSSVRRP
ncbi:MAG TPA: DUF5054 domain-containing protein [Thermoanaerobaculia bacterium]|nr:DUF5054 domain-containing protein [Thermoanaerobaculia bacterium]